MFKVWAVWLRAVRVSGFSETVYFFNSIQLYRSIVCIFTGGSAEDQRNSESSGSSHPV